MSGLSSTHGKDDEIRKTAIARRHARHDDRCHDSGKQPRRMGQGLCALAACVLARHDADGSDLSVFRLHHGGVGLLFPLETVRGRRPGGFFPDSAPQCGHFRRGAVVAGDQLFRLRHGELPLRADACRGDLVRDGLSVPDVSDYGRVAGTGIGLPVRFRGVALSAFPASDRCRRRIAATLSGAASNR